MENRDRLTDFTIPQLLRWRVQHSPDKVALREKEFGRWRNYTWRQYYDNVRKTALGLDKIGLARGETLAVISDNIPEMLVMAVATHATRGHLRRHLPVQPAG